MLDIFDAPWVWLWLGGAGLLGLILGVSFGGIRSRHRRRVAVASVDAAQASAQVAIRDAQERTVSLESEIDDVRGELAASEVEINRMRSGLDQAETRVAELETELAGVKRSAEAEVEALR